MGRISAAVGALALAAFIAAWSAGAFGQTPEMIYGTADGKITLFTPGAVVTAGGGGGTATPLSDAVPKVESGGGAAGVATAASRGDHVHPAAGGGGTATPLSDKTPLVESGSGAAGSGDAASREDHVHPARALPAIPQPSTAAPLAAGTANAGSLATWSRGDHVHPGAAPPAMQVDATCELAESININNAATTAVTWKADALLGFEGRPTGAPTQTGVKFFLGPATSASTRFAGTWPLSTSQDTDFNVLVQRSASNIISISRSGTGTFAWWAIYTVDCSVATTDAALSDAVPKVESGAGTGGSQDTASRGDHVHPARTIPKQPLSSFGTVGSAGTCAKANSSRNGLAYGDCGSPRTLSERDPAAPGTADPGNRTDVSRSDHVHPAQTVAVPQPSTAVPKVESGTGTAGAAAAYSRGDHVHPAAGGGGSATPLSDQTPQNVGAAGKAGTADSASREDHVHGRGAVPREVPAPSNAVKLDIPRVNSGGSAYELVDPHVAVLSGLPAITGHGGNALFVNAAETGVEWKAAAGGGGGSSAAWETLLTLDLSSHSTASTFFNIRIPQTDRAPLARMFGSNILARVMWGRGGDNGDSFGCNLPGELLGSAPSASFACVIGVPNSLAEAIVWLDGCHSSGATAGCTSVLLWGAANFKPSDFSPLVVQAISIGGGGGSSGPSIPAPTAAGASKYLRVNAAGAAYELGADLDADVDEIEEGIAALQRATQDLSVAAVATPWATSTVQGAGIATGTCSTSAAPSSGYAATKARPQAGWPTNTCIFAQLPKGADRTTYRVVEPQGDSATFFDPGGSWRLKLASPSSATRDYYLVNTVSPGDASLTLQHGGTIQRTTFRGRVAAWGGDLPAIPGDTATKDYALQPKADGSGVEWSNEAFSSLMVNAQDIGEALERVGHIDKPGDAEATKSTLAAGQVWEIKSCKDSAGSRTCTAGFSAERHTQHRLVTHGTGAPNATSQSFAGTGRLTQHALISGTSYDEFLIVVRHVSGNPVRTHIRSCRIPGIQGDWLANAAHDVVLTGEGGACTLTAPATGNLTLTWVTPLSGNKILGDMWRLYGLDWQ
ncbi:MAG: hypothetical protein OXP75_01090 [Rhodospirillales bacterium]|nr:hypothetical protein [Rhodospirillales bacterium]